MKDIDKSISQINQNINHINSTNVLRDEDRSITSNSEVDISEYMRNIKDENYKNYIQKKYELILNIFKDMDKDRDSYVDYIEMTEFLNKKMSVNFSLYVSEGSKIRSRHGK